MKYTARFFSGKSGGIVSCSLCPRRCEIANGRFGACGVRGSKNGTGILPFYGKISGLALDPIEKKPLYHFRPCSMILSFGFVGCNLRCPFCQNWHISQSTDSPGYKMPPGEIISAALHENSMAIAYTYSEPLVHAEFILDCMALAHDHGIANVLVTNGCVNAEAANEILSLTDAANIDLKCFSPETYAKTLGGDLPATLEFIRLAHDKDVHVEVTTLIVPGLNDSAEELDACAGFIASLGEIPWHLSAYHPDYRWNAPPTSTEFMVRARENALTKLKYVYAGNIPGEENITTCQHCGIVLMRRKGYKTDLPGLAPPADGGTYYRCAQCGNITPVRFI